MLLLGNPTTSGTKGSSANSEPRSSSAVSVFPSTSADNYNNGDAVMTQIMQTLSSLSDFMKDHHRPTPTTHKGDKMKLAHTLSDSDSEDVLEPILSDGERSSSDNGHLDVGNFECDRSRPKSKSDQPGYFACQ